jgi:peptide-methionine (S)-S-oxide reductase
MRNSGRTLVSIIAVLSAAGIVILGGATAAAQEQEPASAVFAGGCFWCMEKPFDALEGVVSTTSGYAGGHVEDPTYKQVSAGGTGHAEALRVVYDPSKVSYEELLYVYWRNVDPLDGQGQFCDRGPSYRPVIFYESKEQRKLAVRSRDQVARILGKSVEVEIEPIDAFYPAEEYHQDYYEKNSIRYWYYRKRCGRDARLEDVWGDEAGGKDPHPWLGGTS